MRLDVGTREAMQIFIQELWGQTEQTILFITHDLEEAIFMGTRLIVLSQYYQEWRTATGRKLYRI
ncbi:MAG: hypothetical protein MZV63_18330 [Marinilabiliales bacterium]|nr:hypothetical protein [Marinilabiliales bacterium]